MSGGLAITNTLLSLLPGTIVRGILALPTAGVCQVPRNILFKKSRSFIEATEQNKGAFQDLIARLGIGGRQSLLLITGHTDSNGSKELNQALSDRRTRAVRAVLKNDTAEWERLFLIEEGWGTPELTSMSVELGESNDLSFFFGPGADAIAKRRGLFSRYFARLLSGSAVPAITPATPDMLGFGKEQPLHGDKDNPSRDVSQPPILGDHEASRRSEFFFFVPGRAVVRGDYPTWVGDCALTPPAPPIIVTIAPFETVRRNQTIDVQITVAPAAALRATSNVTLKLSATSGAGAAQFVDTGSDTMTIRASQTVKVRGLTVSSVLDNIRLTATVVGQAGAGAQEDFTVVDNIFIHLQFEVFKLTAPSGFVALPAGVTIDIISEGSALNTTIAGQSTDAAGRVVFNLADLSASGRPNPDIFFIARTRGQIHAGHTLPAEWSTKGWMAADTTTPGFQPGFTGPALGTPSAPIVFRVGMDVHARIQYLVDAGARATNIDPAPPQVLVRLMQERTGPDLQLLELRTEADGTIHGVAFDAKPGNTFYLRVDFEMEDSSIHLKRTRVTDSAFLTLSWESNTTDGDNRVFPNREQTSNGTTAAPEVFIVRLDRRNVALFQLKVLRELGVFLFHMTREAWQGVELRVFPRSIAQAFSWPPGQLNIPERSQWSRNTIIHEAAHQVMWEEGKFGTADIAGQFVAGILGLDFLHGCHRPPFRSNERHALIEGWAQFVASIFEGPATPPPFPITELLDCVTEIILDPTDPKFPTSCKCTPLGIPLGPAPGVPNNVGLLVEGGFANGLWGVFEHQVVSTVSPSSHVPEKAREQVLADAPWVRNKDLRDRFVTMIWSPLQALRAQILPGRKTTGRMIEAMEALNPTTWHLLQPELQAFNMAMTVPTLTSIAPAAGPPPGGTRVVITGKDFTFGTTTVIVGGNPTSSAGVTGSTKIEVDTPPGVLGPADVIVATPAGQSAPLAGKFVYANPPVITDLFATGVGPGTSAGGPMSGGTSVTIVGADFDKNARVFFGGLPPAGVEAIPNTNPQPAQIIVDTPAFPVPAHAPGPVDVIVQNPDGQTGRSNAAFQYSLGPAPVIRGVSPSDGPATSDTAIDIQGSNFILNQIKVFIDGQQLRADLIDLGTSSDKSIAANVEALTSSSVPLPHAVDVEVENRDGQRASKPAGFTFT